MNDQSRINLSDAMKWALQDSADASMASADWLVTDIDPRYETAAAMLTDKHTPLRDLRTAKEMFKTMRIVGELPRDRRLGARLYLGAIAAALLHHNERISSQSDGTLCRSLQSMASDESLAEPLRELAQQTFDSLSPADHSGAGEGSVAPGGQLDDSSPLPM